MNKLKFMPGEVIATTVRKAIFLSGPDGHNESAVLQNVFNKGSEGEDWAGAARKAFKSTSKWTVLR